MTYTLVLVRHGESTWNKENRFTGWTDVALSQEGELEAIKAGDILHHNKYHFDVAYCSVLKRAIHTCWAVLKQMNLSFIPVEKSWRLNERHYGALQGLNKAETAQKHGEEQVKVWRRAYRVPPPALSKQDARWPGNEKMYKNIPGDVLPLTECLDDCVLRVLPFWFDTVAPAILSGKNVIVVAHGNSLRGLVKHLEDMTENEVLELNIPTGVPLIYHLDEELKPLKKFYLMDEQELKLKMDAVASQGKAK